MTPRQHWWQKTTIYQIYPRSFADSNDDGIGDLRGIISSLDYVKDLGFETIWLSPFFRSPQGDWGYDISDFYTAAPEYGDLADIEMLIDQTHQREMRVLFDLVMNHTSVEHPWFQESRSSRDNPRRDWYIWKDGTGNRPPNNWKAVPGGPGWHYDATTDQWYMLAIQVLISSILLPAGGDNDYTMFNRLLFSLDTQPRGESAYESRGMC